ncbi:hypothetical protein BGZ63DRAFT_452554 [Mariannaea sp. PMI_226]|nr:hypothetical protein BGZ63DRAFT_452554 [Mariannaea sp. PMI_226]
MTSLRIMSYRNQRSAYRTSLRGCVVSSNGQPKSRQTGCRDKEPKLRTDFTELCTCARLVSLQCRFHLFMSPFFMRRPVRFPDVGIAANCCCLSRVASSQPTNVREGCIVGGGKMRLVIQTRPLAHSPTQISLHSIGRRRGWGERLARYCTTSLRTSCMVVDRKAAPYIIAL